MHLHMRHHSVHGMHAVYIVHVDPLSLDKLFFESQTTPPRHRMEHSLANRELMAELMNGGW